MKKHYSAPLAKLICLNEDELLTLSVKGSSEAFGDLADWDRGYIVG